jgi:hypothetical protein
MTASPRFVLRALPCVSLLLACSASCTLENPAPELPLAVAPGYEVIQVPNPPSRPATWDRRVNKMYDKTWEPPADGAFPEGQSAHPFFRDPVPTKGDGDG